MPILKSVSSELPDPPYPEDTKANGYKPEFDIRRIKQSKTWKLADPKTRNILLRLWLESWEEIPVGSFENDDELIAASIDVDLELFQGYRKQIMRGWKLHSDGRLYHHFITEQVLDMLKRRRKSADKVRDWREKKALENAKCNQLPTSNQPVSNRQEQEQEQDITPLPPSDPSPKKPRTKASALTLPPEINSKAWDEFCQHRLDIRKPLSKLATTKNLNILKTMTASQQQEAVDATIANRWTGLFPPKQNSKVVPENQPTAARRVRL